MKIEIENGDVFGTLANVCQVGVNRLTMKPCSGGFTVLLDSKRSLGRYNINKRLFAFTRFGKKLTLVTRS